MLHIKSFETFRPRKISDRKDTPEGRRIEAIKQLNQQGVPLLAAEFAQKINAKVEPHYDLENVWSIESKLKKYSRFNIVFNLNGTWGTLGFQIADEKGTDLYYGTDLTAALRAVGRLNTDPSNI